MSQIQPEGDSMVPSEPVLPSPRFIRLLRMQAVPGYLPAMRQPVMLADFQLLADAPEPVLQEVAQVVQQVCKELPQLQQSAAYKRWPALACVMQSTLALLQRIGWPLLTPLKVVGANTKGQQVSVAIPSLHAGEQAVASALQGALLLLNAVAEGNGTKAAEGLHERLKRMQVHAPQGMNSLRFLQAAHDLNIPWQRLTGNIFLFGWGAKARWLDSSMTDQTPNLAVKIARDKRSAAQLLRQAGLPVPLHYTVGSAEEALSAAAHLGYPVVVKPADLDGGKGVFAWLATPEAVTQAWEAAAELSGQILVEKHCFGNDYRLQVFQGEVFWAVHRVPAGVTGDGKLSVRELVQLANADPRRGGEPASRLKWIQLDSEAEDWLARQALHAGAVPEKGRFVRLRGAANVASGGTTVPVLDSAHPDNLALAVRAAAVMRLDIAGVDLLIPDLARSWHESGAAICEVNAQPQMSAHLPAFLLPRLVQGQGRIPALVVLGAENGAPACATLFAGLTAACSGFGLATADGAWVDGVKITGGPLDGYRAARCLLLDPAVTMLALHAADSSMLRTGCACDRIDHLVLAGPVYKDGVADWSASLLLAAWLAGVADKVWLLDDAPQWQHARLQKAGVPAGRSEVRDVLAQVIRAAKPGTV